MTQMESPKRKMQKKNDYQRHKLFRKIKRRRKAQAEAEQHIAEKQLRKKLKLPKFDTGDDARMVYLRDIVGHDPHTGEDILKTGERVNRRLPSVNVNQRDLSKVDAAERNQELRDLREHMGDDAFDKYMSDLQFKKDIKNAQQQTWQGNAADYIDKGMTVASLLPVLNKAGDVYFGLRGVSQLVRDGDISGALNAAPLIGKVWNKVPLRKAYLSYLMNKRQPSLADYEKYYRQNFVDQNLYFRGPSKFDSRIGRKGYSDTIFDYGDDYKFFDDGDGVMSFNSSGAHKTRVRNTYKNADDYTIVKEGLNDSGSLNKIGVQKNFDNTKWYGTERQYEFPQEFYVHGEKANKNIQINKDGSLKAKPTTFKEDQPKVWSVSNAPYEKGFQRYVVSPASDYNGQVLNGIGGFSDKTFRVTDNLPLRNAEVFEFNPLFGGFSRGRFFNSGKDIRIKPSKRGTFTKAAKQHGMSVQSFANKVLRNPSKYSAVMRKKANFAHNASKWKH